MRQNTANYNLDVDHNNDYNIKLGEAVNVVIKQGSGDIYYDTKENWDEQLFLVTKRSAIYIYSDKSYITDPETGEQKAVPGIKIGDGTSYLIDMPFVGDEEIFELAVHINDHVSHITQEERNSWNNKITGFLDQEDSENLILSKI